MISNLNTILMRFLHLLLLMAVIAAVLTLKQSQFLRVHSSNEPSSLLSRILEKKKLVVLMINSPFHLVYTNGSAGFNDDLVMEFAQNLGVEVDIIHSDGYQYNEMTPDIIIGLAKLPGKEWSLGPSIYTQHLQLVTFKSTNPQTLSTVNSESKTGVEAEISTEIKKEINTEVKKEITPEIMHPPDELSLSENADHNVKLTDTMIAKQEAPPVTEKISEKVNPPELAISELVQQSATVSALLTQDESSGYLLSDLSKEDETYAFSAVQSYESGSPFSPLLGLIAGKEDFAIVDSVSAAIFRRIYPDLKIVSNIAENESFAWYFFTPNHDTSLLQAFKSFHQSPSTLNVLDKLAEKYFTPIAPFNNIDTYHFIHSVKNRLPEYKPFFIAHAKEFDWRLIAAIAYQESHWDPLAKSPTGVRGIMMLTRDTASYFGIDDRLDTEKSILGGVQYLRFLLKRVPKSVAEDERIWFALAGYNMGIGHLWDARHLTSQRGGDPDSWHDVKKNLPLLRDKTIYPDLKFGFARGDEALIYVENIRRYYTSLLALEALNTLHAQESRASSMNTVVDILPQLKLKEDY